MNEVLQKVRQEKVLLDDKIQKLGKFLSSDESLKVSSKQMALLRAQLNAMESYYQILVLRIDNLEKEDKNNGCEESKESC